MADIARRDRINDETLRGLIQMSARSLSKLRKIKNIARQYKDILRQVDQLPSTEDEMSEDWRAAEVFISLKILNGDTFLLSSLEPKSYPLIEGIWMEELKQQMAYYNWEQNENNTDKENYYLACREIRKLLIYAKQEPLAHFETFKDYIEETYLEYGIFDTRKTLEARNLVARKANQIYVHMGKNDDIANWFRAEMYVHLFYENIIPAIEFADKKNIANVLRAFEFSKAKEHSYLISNAFEVSIAIYFLDKDAVKEVLSEPSEYDYSMVEIERWFIDEKVKDKYYHKLEYNRISKELIFIGVMTKDERDELIRAVKEPECVNAIDELFVQSNMSPYVDMIL
jgi:hypothetical protein